MPDINKDLFSSLLSELESFFNRNFSPFAVRAWYKQINAQLTSEQFEQAIEMAVTQCQFMPTAIELIALVKGSPDVLAQSEWDRCLTAAARADSSLIADISEAGKFALKSIGGVSGLGYCDESQMPWKKKEFLQCWKSFNPAVDLRALPPASVSGQIQAEGIDRSFAMPNMGMKR